MTKYLLCLVLILLFSNAVAVAQSIYAWKDEKGQWYFSDVVPPGMSAKKMLDPLPKPESTPATSQTQPDASPLAIGKSQEKAFSNLPIADSLDIPPAASALRWLLISRRSAQAQTENSRRFSWWNPVQAFDSDEACFRYQAALATEYGPFPGNCIPAHEFTTGKEADVSVTDTQFEPVAVGFSGQLLSGRVFNRGQDTARNVVAKYRIRDRNGVIIAEGEASTSPADVPGMAFGEFRTPSIGGWSLEGVRAHTEANWVKNKLNSADRHTSRFTQ
jgi:hypothetical protein